MPRKRLTAPAARVLREAYLLSPASIAGLRAKQLRSPSARFDLAKRLRAGGASLGEVYTFCSALYFRGKSTYAAHFCPPGPAGAVRVITPNRGLLAPETALTLTDLDAFAEVDIDASNALYRGPLERDASDLAAQLAPDGRVILLGSVASPKYRDVLLPIFGDRLVFPEGFVGRGDMSRGALLLRHAKLNTPIPMIPVSGTTLRGRRVSGGFPTV